MTSIGILVFDFTFLPLSLALSLKQLAQAHEQIVVPLENFRKERIGGVKENKKKFDKKTAKFCQAQERFLNMSSKKPDNTIQEVSERLCYFRSAFFFSSEFSSAFAVPLHGDSTKFN